jgi:hypothetical protein
MLAFCNAFRVETVIHYCIGVGDLKHCSMGLLADLSLQDVSCGTWTVKIKLALVRVV